MRTTSFKTSALLALGLLAGAGLTAQAAVTVPDWLMAPASSVNTNQPGFNVKTVQTDSVLANDGNRDYLTEEMLAPSAPNVSGTALDPGTGLPADNLVDYTGALNGLPPATNQYWVVTNVISFQRDASAYGAYDGASIDGFGTTQFPGIPGSTGSKERFACEAITYLYLNAGTNTFIVNTDDDFKLTIGVRNNPYDAFRVEAGRFEGGRGATDSKMTVIIQTSGYYPVRCTYDQGTGGANWNFFSDNGGNQILINDRSNTNAILAYVMPPLATASFVAPYALSVTPAPGAQGALPDLVQVVLTNGTVALDTNSLSLWLDGTNVHASVTVNTNNQTVVAYAPSPLLPPGSSHTAVLMFKDKAATPNSYTNTWSFSVLTYATLTSDMAIPAGKVDTTKTGFTVRTSVIDLPYNMLNGVWRAQQQMEGLMGTALFGAPFANVAIPGPNSDGSYTETNVINYDISPPHGDFQAPDFPDAPFPGIPGNAVLHGNATDNSAAEITTFLDLKKGVYKMIVNSDDDFQVFAGPNYKDLLTTPLGTYDTTGGRGANDSQFPVVVQSDGIYAFRLLWENGTGGANLEWSFIDPVTGNKVLINNLTNTPTILKAYYSGQGRAYISSITPFYDTVHNNVRMEAQDVDPATPVTVKITDAATTVDPTTVKLTLDGTAVTPTTTKSGGVTTTTFTPASPFAAGSRHVAQISYTESDGTTRTASWAFNIRQVFTVGQIKNEFWQKGNYNTDENALLAYPDAGPPDIVRFFPQWDSPYPDNNEQGNNYTERLSAYFQPSKTATYVFFTSSDDYSELYLSSDRDLVNFIRIAQEPGWNNPQNWVNTDRRSSTSPQNRTDFNQYVPVPIQLQAGKKYFLMQLHSEGGGGDHEDMLVMNAADVTAPVGGGSGEPDNSFPPTLAQNDPNGVGTFGLYQYLGPQILSASPPAGQNSTLQQALDVVLGQGSYPIDDTSIQLWLDGVNVTSSSSINSLTNPAGAVEIKYLYPVLPAGTNTVTIIAADKGTPPTTVTNQYTFITQPLTALDVGMGTKLGSGDTNNPGFRYRLKVSTSSSLISHWEQSNLQEEVLLAGGCDPYTDPSTYIWTYTGTDPSVPPTLTYTVGTDGYAAITNVINFNHNATFWGGNGDIGNFQQPAHPDNPIPGLAVDTLGDNSADDYVVAEMLTYIEFPSAGYYEMGVNSDDDFRVSSATNQDFPTMLVKINSPSAMATNMVASEADFGPPLPKLADIGPVTGKIVETQPLDASSALTNPDAIKGNIALIDRGAVTFANKISAAQTAGAIGVIIADNNGPDDLIITMGGGLSGLNIPAVMINYQEGLALHTAVEGGTTVNATLSSHHFTTLGNYQGGRGSSDTLFAFSVPEAGVYPMRLMWDNGTGGANCEWFTVDRATGKKTLVNDLSSTNSVHAFRARANIPLPPPIIHPTMTVSVSGTTLTFTWQGTGFKLQSSTSLTSPNWADVPGQTSSPATDKVSGNTKFYRLTQ